MSYEIMRFMEEKERNERQSQRQPLGAALIIGWAILIITYILI